MTNINIKTELLKCQEAAERGYKLAKDNWRKIERSLQKAEQQITTANSEQNQLQNIQYTTLLEKQNEELQNLRKNIEGIKTNIDSLYELRKDFSIAVFGRTMAGKSTLMEILTQGNGASIGKGAQRTTTDIRTYYWQGLKITDLPGLDFFDNAEKDKIGMEVAKTADLVLFLLTDEEPQPEEMQCLAQLKSLGKLILCIVNVKKNLNFKKRAVSLKELNKIFSDTTPIDSIVAKFKENAKNYHQNWSDVKFVPTHLAAAYYSQSNVNEDTEIFQASNFDEVERFIREKVRIDGRFLRVKNFVDSVAVPMNQILLTLFEHGKNSLKESKIITDKSKKILMWRQEIWDHSQKKLQELFEELSTNLKAEIPKFVEENYNAADINKKCSEFFQSLGYNERYQQLFDNFSAEYKDGLQKFSDELTQELAYSFNSKPQTNIQIEEDDTLRKYLIAIAPSLLMFVPEISLTTVLAVTVGNTILNLVIDKMKDKDSTAKQKVLNQMTESGFDMLNQINRQAHDVFNKQISGTVEEFANTLVNYAHMFARLGASQSKIAETLIDDYSKLNTVLFVDAIDYKNAGEFAKINATMRIPGTISVIIADASDINTKKVSSLMNERFFVMNSLGSWESTIKKMLGCDFDLDRYSLGGKTVENTYSITPQGKVSAKRSRLTQQISPYPIMSE